MQQYTVYRETIPTLQKRKTSRNWMAWSAFALLLPFLVYTILFWLWPFLWGTWISFTDEKMINMMPASFIGLENYMEHLYSDEFYQALLFSTRFFSMFIPLMLIFSMGVALLLSKVKRFRGFYILGFLSAYTMSSVAYSIVFQMLLSENGPVNTLFQSLFGVTIPWFTEPAWATFAIALLVAWKFTGYYGLIFLAGLESIPQELYDAAKLEGISPVKRFLHITLPLMNASIVIVIVFATILSFNIFTEPLLITDGGPAGSTTSFIFLVYQNAFAFLGSAGAGNASALAILTAFITFVAVLTVKKIVEREVNI